MSAWTDRIGDVIEQCLSAGFRYGPISRKWRGGSLVVGANWTPGRREPFVALRRKLDGVEANWPGPCATCSPFVEIVLRLLYGWSTPDAETISRSVGGALKSLPVLEAVARDAHPKRWRAFDFASLPDELPAALCVALYRGHVVLIVDCDRVPARNEKGNRFTGRRVLGADGSFRDTKDKRGKTLRRYSCAPLRWESVAARAKREASRSDRRRKFALVGLAPPAVDRWPSSAPILDVQ